MEVNYLYAYIMSGRWCYAAMISYCVVTQKNYMPRSYPMEFTKQDTNFSTMVSLPITEAGQHKGQRTLERT
jgi:hypothetical protein